MTNYIINGDITINGRHVHFEQADSCVAVATIDDAIELRLGSLAQVHRLLRLLA
ncbi:hypothetical protein [Bifidobacterium tsurumiense]|uniref:hypothetical protein n=1 Tax=Bifidobacterium tsurumiense TaxID=356829 RepID=UPI000A626FF9|nr:hypothetical protein [Bifidobacterium tsurumiense]MDY4678450.1 hypothetical protein [Bifidobacterium tsurumiense]